MTTDEVSRTGKVRRWSAAAIGVLLLAQGIWLFGNYLNDFIRYRGFGPPISLVPRSQRGAMHHLTVAAPVATGRLHADVYVPAGYVAHPGQRYPVLYYLHGTPGSPGRTNDILHIYDRLDQLVATGTVRPFIIVAPRGTASLFDHATDWADGPWANQKWFTAVTDVLVGEVDRRYRTLANPHDRGIAGLSAGANASLNAVILKPDVFGLAEGWSGDYSQDPKLVGFDQQLVDRFSASQTAGVHASRMARLGVQVRLYTGRHDSVAPRAETVRLADTLRAGGVRVTVRVLNGGHSWNLWNQQTVATLVWFGRNAA